MSKILYLGSPSDFDTHTARLLWLIDGSQPESVGLLQTSPDGRGTAEVVAQRPLSQYQAFGISIEPAGGSDQPTTTPIVVVSL